MKTDLSCCVKTLIFVEFNNHSTSYQWRTVIFVLAIVGKGDKLKNQQQQEYEQKRPKLLILPHILYTGLMCMATTWGCGTCKRLKEAKIKKYITMFFNLKIKNRPNGTKRKKTHIFRLCWALKFDFKSFNYSFNCCIGPSNQANGFTLIINWLSCNVC